MNEQQEQQAAADAAAQQQAAVDMAALQQQMQAMLAANVALQAQVDQLNAAAAAAAAVAAPVPPAGAVPVPAVVPAPAVTTAVKFAETPGTYDVDNLLDLNSKTGTALFNQAIKPLGTKFDMTSGGLVVFLEQFLERAKLMGWSEGLYTLTRFTNAAGRTCNLYDEYGQIDAASISTQCEPFMDKNGTLGQSRVRQNNKMMALCLMASLTDDARARIQPYSSEYVRHGEVCAPLLFKTQMRLATIDSVATTESLRTSLRELKDMVPSLNYDLPKIQTLYHQYYSQLIARGATVDDPIGILFGIYLAINCTKFQAYIQRKHDMYYDGELTGLTHETLMASANDKYTHLVSTGEWRPQQSADPTVIALTAELEKLKGQFKLAPNLKQHASKQEWKKVGSNGRAGGGKAPPSKTKNKKSMRDRREQVKDEAWKKKAPAAGEATTKTVNQKTYHWCIHHMAWTIHTSSECRMGSTRVNNQNNRMVAHRATTAAPQVAANQNTQHESYAAAIISNMARIALND
jgi:hypothetical protein